MQACKLAGFDADSDHHNVEVEYRTPIGKPADYVLMDSDGFPLCIRGKKF